MTLMALSSACGGGVGGGTPAPTPPTASTGPLSASTTSLIESDDISEAPLAPAVVTISVANPPATNLSYKVVWSGSAVASATFAWQSAAAGQLTINFPTPLSLGAGVYSGSVQLTACTDVGCIDNVSGSPVTVSVSYTVTQASGAAATFYVQTATAGFEAHTTDTRPPSAAFNVYLQHLPTAGLYIQLHQPTSGFITGVTDTQSTDNDGGVTVAISMMLKLPATLGSGFFTSSVTFDVCYDKACAHPLTGSPLTEPIYYTIYLTEGHDYSLTTARIGGISDLAYDPVGQKLYVSGLSGYSNSSSGAVTQIDPLSGAIGTHTALNDSLFGMAIAADGSYLYVGSTINPILYRLSLPSLTPDITIALGSSGDPCCGGGANTVSEVAVVPGAPRTVVVALAHPHSTQTGGTVVYDDSVARPQWLQPLGYYAEPDAISWGASATSLIVSRYSSQQPLAVNIASVPVGASGLSIASSVSLNPSTYSFSPVFYGAGRVYDLFGHVIDATTGAALGQFAFPAGDDPTVALLPDPSHGRVFILHNSGGTGHLWLLSYDASSFALQAVIDLGVDQFDVALTTHMILVGLDGVAFNRNGVQIISGTLANSSAAAGTEQRAKRLSSPASYVIHVQPRAGFDAR